MTYRSRKITLMLWQYVERSATRREYGVLRQDAGTSITREYYGAARFVHPDICCSISMTFEKKMRRRLIKNFSLQFKPCQPGLRRRTLESRRLRFPKIALWILKRLSIKAIRLNSASIRRLTSSSIFY